MSNIIKRAILFFLCNKGEYRAFVGENNCGKYEINGEYIWLVLKKALI